MEDGKPSLCSERADECIGCQHCMAVCPTGALDIPGLCTNSSICLPADIPSPDQMEILIKSRRTTRQYKNKMVDRDILDRLLDVTAYAPTGGNCSQVHRTLVYHPGQLTAFRTRVYEAIEQHVDSLPEDMDRFKEIIKDWKNGKDKIFRGAPHLLITSVPSSAVTPKPDGLIALTYFELQAAVMGLGTTWCGLLEMVLTRIAPELAREINIPEDHEIGYAMLFGWPGIRYHRTVQHRQGPVNYVHLNTPDA